MQESVESIRKRVSTTTVMTEAIKFFAISLAIVVILNLIFLIVKERIREIATMKVLGQQLHSIILSLFFEIMFMGLIGAVIGIIFGYPLLTLVLSINKIESLNYIYKIGFMSFVSSVFIVFITIIIMMGLCYYKVKNIGMIESLKSSE
jgi:putative ABC transport system permease protein